LGKSLGLVSCSKSKSDHRCRAREMYQASDLFKKAFGYACSHYDFVAILSAKYGALMPDEEIDPYEMALMSMNMDDQRKWAEKAFSQLESKLPLETISEVFLHVGSAYRRYLAELLEQRGIECVVPLRGLSIGKQKAWYLAHG
jgi:hypothetical protein